MRKIATNRLPRHKFKQNYIALHGGEKSTHSAKIGSLVPGLKKYPQKPKSELKANLFRGKITFNMATFNVKTLNTKSQLPELIASAANENIDIICIQEHRL